MTIAATLDLAEASDRLWDAIVVGAGPAGSLAARELARRGAAVLLVDKASFPRWKVCGACLNGRALATLAGVGLGELARRWDAVPVQDLQLTTRGSKTLISLHGGVALSREVFDAALIEAAVQAGVAFLPRTSARLDGATGAVRRVTLSQNGHQTMALARVVLAADGLGGGFAGRETACRTVVEPGSRLGAGVIVDAAPVYYRPGTIYMACGASGYLGLVRLEDNRLNIAAAFDATRVKQAGGLGKQAKAILAETGLPAMPGLATASWRGTPFLTRCVHPTAFHRAFLLGDAAGYVEPFTGEGMAWALASACALAPLAYRACQRWDPAIARQWSFLYRQIVARRQWVCHSVAYVLRRPTLTRFLVGTLAHAPGLAAPFVRCINGSSKMLVASRRALAPGVLPKR
jgi:2-polyprenyl-6-methoxyphenol hydroxylase-like FAD-dependent oxidoreductase